MLTRNTGGKFDVIKPNILEALCRAIGTISEGLSGTDINKYLNDGKFNIPNPDITKWKRLYVAFDQKQQYCGNSNDLLNFITLAIHPSRILRYGTDSFKQVVSTLNEPLSFIGLELGLDGVFRGTSISKTVDDAQKKADMLHEKLKLRDVHPDFINIVMQNF